jgi:PQQ-dependent catabolism-associated CXXCW motif protein
MRSMLLLSLAALTISNRPLAAQDSFGGYPAAAPDSGQAAQPGAAPGGSADLDRLMQVEREDFGVKATAELHSGAMHAPTPNTIPGGQVITTKGLLPLLANQQLGALIFDILGGPEMIPGARPAVPASQAGSFNDQNQQQFSQYLQSLTKGNMNVPLVFYCLSSHCWMSYNASLRAINMGYKNVLWYRGGIEAWKAAGQQVQQARGGQ